MEVSPEFLLYMSFIGTSSTALMQLLKQAFLLPKKYIPVFTLVLGVGLALAPFPFTSVAITERVWAGALAGLGGTGIFENVQKSRKN